MKIIIRNFLIFLTVAAFISLNFIVINKLTSINSDKTQLKPKIVLISHVITNPYWNYIRYGAEKAAKERNAIIDFQGPDAPSAKEGIKLINMAYSSRADGIITYIQDQYKYNNIINTVIKSGVPLVTIDSDAEKSNRLAYVGTDNISAGRKGAKELIKQIGITGNIGIIIGGKDVKNQIERIKGFREYIDKNSELKIVDIESSDAFLLEAEIAANQILVKDPGIKALFCTSALDGLGAEKAVSSLKMDGKVKIICFDDLPETLEKIKEGKIAATIVQKPIYMGYKAVEIIMDRIEGRSKGKRKLFLTGVEVIDSSNIDAYIKMQGEMNVENK
ncbi:MAG TPA: substrate-binding domain-containing protein [Clostridia bacterium]|nr:substrate-binding domain-containing protein [Clostridia bacterium]